MFDQIVADAEKFAAALKAARDPNSPSGAKLAPGEILGLVGLGAKIVADVAGLGIKL